MVETPLDTKLCFTVFPAAGAVARTLTRVAVLDTLARRITRCFYIGDGTLTSNIDCVPVIKIINKELNTPQVRQATVNVLCFRHSISHSHRRNKRRFDPNVQKKTYWVPSLRRKVTLNVSAKGIKVIDVRGIDAVVADIIARGEKI